MQKMSSKGPLSAETWACLQNQIAFLHEILQPSKFHFGDASSCASSPLPLLSAFTSVFLPLQDIGSPHASVGSPLEGQKVKLSAFFSHSCPLCVPPSFPFHPCVCLDCHACIRRAVTRISLHVYQKHSITTTLFFL